MLLPSPAHFLIRAVKFAESLIFLTLRRTLDATKGKLHRKTLAFAIVKRDKYTKNAKFNSSLESRLRHNTEMKHPFPANGSKVLRLHKVYQYTPSHLRFLLAQVPVGLMDSAKAPPI